MSENIEQGSHFWFASFAKNDDAMFFSGTCMPSPSATRMDMFNDITSAILAEHPETADAVVIAFDIQPNKI